MADLKCCVVRGEFDECPSSFVGCHVIFDFTAILYYAEDGMNQLNLEYENISCQVWTKKNVEICGLWREKKPEDHDSQQCSVMLAFKLRGNYYYVVLSAASDLCWFSSNIKCLSCEPLDNNDNDYCGDVNVEKMCQVHIYPPNAHVLRVSNCRKGSQYSKSVIKFLVRYRPSHLTKTKNIGVQTSLIGNNASVKNTIISNCSVAGITYNFK